MKIRIVTEKPGWIMHRMAEEIKNALPETVINKKLKNADITYFINYGFYKPAHDSTFNVACFTHYDPNHLAERFEEVAHSVDYCIAISNETAESLKQLGIPEEKIEYEGSKDILEKGINLYRKRNP